jgi:hypothetical protein
MCDVRSSKDGVQRTKARGMPQTKPQVSRGRSVRNIVKATLGEENESAKENSGIPSSYRPRRVAENVVVLDSLATSRDEPNWERHAWTPREMTTGFGGCGGAPSQRSRGRRASENQANCPNDAVQAVDDSQSHVSDSRRLCYVYLQSGRHWSDICQPSDIVNRSSRYRLSIYAPWIEPRPASNMPSTPSRRACLRWKWKLWRRIAAPHFR